MKKRRNKAEDVANAAADSPLLLKTTPVAGRLGAGSAEATAEAVQAAQIEARDFREEALRRAKEDPATAALVLRHWLGTAVSDQHDTSNAA